MPINLLEPFLQDGIRHSHFFNGRLLTAEALETEQIANLDQRRLLGQAVGAGIARGLEVNLVQPSDPPTVLVKEGLAITPAGDSVHLTRDVQLVLDAESDRNTPINGAFTVCKPVTDQLRYTGAGIYLLVMAPATAPSVEQTPSQGFSTGSSVLSNAYCDFQDTVLGVQFRLLNVDVGNPHLVGEEMADALLEQLEDSREPARSLVRNLTGYLFLGGDVSARSARDPFELINGESAYHSYGLLDIYRAMAGDTGIKDYDVPLAVLYWDRNGIVFVDMWPVRRPLQPSDLSPYFPHVGQHRAVEGAATFRQFQAHLRYLTNEGANRNKLNNIRANAYFEYLPPVGILPLGNRGTFENPGHKMFFTDIPIHEPIYIEGSRLLPLIQHSFTYPPVYIKGDEITMLWIYYIRENQQAIDTEGARAPQHYVVFSSGHMAYMGDPHFDVNRWGYSTFA